MSKGFKFLAVILGALFLINLFGPRETVDWTISFSENDIGPDVEAYLSTSEGLFDDIIEGAQKEVIWAGEAGAKTALSIVYVHGFSATKEEIRPVPDNVAEALGANLYFTRLAGHGRGGPAMAQASANDWLNDVAEAAAIGRAIGERVVIIATSQGGTMTAMSALDPDVMRNVAGIVFVSPNFGIADKSATLLTMPFARTFAPWFAGTERSFEPINEGQEKWWTTRYPLEAVFPVVAAVQAAAALPFEVVLTPALFIYSPQDTVVRASEIERVAENWAGPKEIWAVDVGAGDDPAAHVIAGDILSPSLTEPVSARILDWISGL